MNHEQHPHPMPEKPFWRSPSGIAFLGFLAITGFFLLTEHRAHALGVLPFALVALCPLLHFFGHRGNGHGEGPENHR